VYESHYFVSLLNATSPCAVELMLMEAEKIRKSKLFMLESETEEE